MMRLVAVVGRPNVGKSTLVNRIVARRQAITEKDPGVTRDRNYYPAEWRGRAFQLIDTGGLDPGTEDGLQRKMGEQALMAVREADLVLMLVDGKEGLTSHDLEVAAVLRETGRQVLLAVNKVDDPRREAEYASDFHSLGFGDLFAISALHGLGIGDLLDAVTEALFPAGEGAGQEGFEPEAEKEGPVTVAILGRPNVGKSSLFNRLIGQERSIIFDKPGTTRDTVDTEVMLGGRRLVFVDTAGWRRRTKIEESVEYFSLVRLWKVLDRAEVAILMVDASEGVTDQDQRIAARIKEDGIASVVVLNKWDLVKDAEEPRETLDEARYALRFIEYSPFLRVSALSGFGVNKIVPTLLRSHESWKRRIPTPQLNRLKEDIILHTPPSSRRGRHLQVYYVTQAGTGPPHFVFFVNNPALVRPDFQRYLERRIRETFDFTGTPIRVSFKGKKGREP
jgi:GTP-binding protein